MKKRDYSFWQLVRIYLTIYLPKHRCFSKNTVGAYSDSLDLFSRFMREAKGVRLMDIAFNMCTHDCVRAFLDWLRDERKCCTSTCNLRLAALKSFLYFAAVENPALVAVYLPIKQVPAGKEPRKKASYLTKPALKAVMAQPDPKTLKGLRNRFIMIMLYDTGARIQELLDITVKDLNLDIETPCVYLHGKGNKIRCIPLMDKTIVHLKEYLKHFHPAATRDVNQYLFYTTIKGNTDRISVDSVAWMLKKYGEAARMECPEVPERIHPHQLRHSRAQHLYQDGMPLSYIAEFLGHASMNTTNVYASADTSMMRAAIEKASNSENTEQPIWRKNEAMISKLCGL
jgi:site-specific recombinase XerD